MAKTTLEERFWAKVARRGAAECWLWTGATASKGYGRFYLDSMGPRRKRIVQAHRVAYELLIGPIPTGLHIDHLCRVPACVNPAHLEPVTRRENTRRHFSRQTHCKRGHPLSGNNLIITTPGWRNCRACHRLYTLARTEARRAARRMQREYREL